MRITEMSIIRETDNTVKTKKEWAKNIDCDSCRCPHDVKFIMNNLFSLSKRTEEYLYLICLNAKNKIIGVFEISHGTDTCSVASIKGIILRALLTACHSVIMVHNHPSGDFFPSTDDINTTKKTAALLNAYEVPLADHIIIAGNDCYSFRENNEELFEPVNIF